MKENLELISLIDEIPSFINKATQLKNILNRVSNTELPFNILSGIISANTELKAIIRILEYTKIAYQKSREEERIKSK